MTAPTQDDIIYVKQSLNYYLAEHLLGFLHGFGCYRDERFRELLTSLEDYVRFRIEFPDGLEIIDDYIVYECVKI